MLGAQRPRPKSVGYFKDTHAGFMIDEEVSQTNSKQGGDANAKNPSKKAKRVVYEPGATHAEAWPT